MKNRLGHFSFIVFDESHLGIGSGQKEICFGFRKDLSLVLTGWLNKEFVAVATEDETKTGRELIFACVRIKDFWIKLNRFVLFRWFKLCEWVPIDEQVTANVVDIVCGVRQHHHTLAVLL